jgi:hypothetical protein
MRKLSVGTALALCLAASAAVAQDRPVTSRQDRADTVKINVSGRLAMDFVWRSRGMTAVTDSITTGGSGQDSAGENTIEGEYGIRFDMDLTDKIAVQIEIGKNRINEDGTGWNEFSGIGAEGVMLREAHLMIHEVFSPNVKAQLGIATWNFDVRGKGNAFAFDPRRSQSFTRAWQLSEDTLGVGGSLATRSGTPGETFPAGAVLTYGKDALQMDLVLLPVISEAGKVQRDEAMYAVDLWYNLDEQVGKGSRLGVIAAINSFGAVPGATPAGFADSTHVFTLGGGATLVFGGLEIYAEGYFQTSRAGEAIIAGEEEKVSARGRAGQIGFEYRLPENANNVWLGAKVTYVSGDGDEATENNDTVNNFLSYENVRDTLIMEDQYYGFDVDVNYTALKLMGGMAFSAGQGKNNVEVSVIVAFFKANQDHVSAGNSEDKLGNEIDLKLVYHMNKQLKLLVNFGYLSGSELLEEATGGSASDESRDKAVLFTAGFDVRF